MKLLLLMQNMPPWITPTVKTALRRNNRVFKKWVQRGKIPTEKARVDAVQVETNTVINIAKAKYTGDLGDNFVTLILAQNASGQLSTRYLIRKKYQIFHL